MDTLMTTLIEPALLSALVILEKHRYCAAQRAEAHAESATLHIRNAASRESKVVDQAALNNITLSGREFTASLALDHALRDIVSKLGIDIDEVLEAAR